MRAFIWKWSAGLLACGLMGTVSQGADVGTAFTYQGELVDDGELVSASCDFEFTLWDDAAAGSQVGGVVAQTIDVSDGLFSTSLDFGVGVFTGEARWLEVSVCCASPCSPAFVTLDPRQELTPAPYALHAVNAPDGHSLDADDGDPVDAVYVDADGRVGVGTTAPLRRFHFQLDDLAMGTEDLLSNDEFIIEQEDARIVLVGGPTGTTGSLLILREINVGDVTDEWRLRRLTSPNGSDLVFSYNQAFGVNNDLMTIQTDGRVAVAGVIESTTGGFEFPDGSVQATAAVSDGDTLGELTCADGEVAKWNNTLAQWECSSDETGSAGNTLDAAYDEGGAGAGRIITADSGAVRIEGNDGLEVLGTIQSGNSIIIDGSTGAERIISSDALEIHTSTGRIMRLEPEAVDVGGDHTAPNIIAGWTGNGITSGVVGATVSGGGSDDGGNPFPNMVTDDLGTIGGGYGNRAGDDAGSTSDARGATVAGGVSNKASGEYASIGGGQTNLALARYATIAGGGPTNPSSDPDGSNNRVFDDWGTIGGGGYNRAGSDDSNSASDRYATVAGGDRNHAQGLRSTVSGGYFNNAGDLAVVGGGSQNAASALHSTISGGDCNEASQTGSTVGGGRVNIANGSYATIPGGIGCTAAGAYSFAAGRNAKANHLGSFVWGGGASSNVTSTQDNQFTARTIGGARFFSNSFLTTGVSLAPGGGSWSSISDRSVKENVEQVDAHALLERLSQVPIATWNYESQDPGIRHIGPMAQDFYAAFSVGEDERYITGIDADGVALAAIQGLHSLVEEKDCRINDLESKNARLESRLARIEAMLERVEQGGDK